jgi:hypothetical protein
MSDTADTAQVIIRPPIAWALAVLAGLTLNWLMPLPFVPGMLLAGWLGTSHEPGANTSCAPGFSTAHDLQFRSRPE